MAAGYNSGGVKEALKTPVEEAPAPSSEEDIDREFDAINEKFDSQTKIPRVEDFEDEEDDDTEIPPAREEEDDSDSDAGDAVDLENDEGDEDDDATQRAALAEAYGMDVDQLAHFSSYKDAENALRMLDQWAYQQGQQALQGQQQQGQPPWQQQPQQPPVQGQQQQTAQQQLAALKLELEEWGPDEPVAKNFQTLQTYVQQLEDRHRQLEQYLVALADSQAQQEAQRRISEFHNQVDKLDSTIFGKGDKLTPLQRQRRHKLAMEVDAMEYGYRGRGMNVPSLDQLVKRTVDIAFGDLTKKEQIRNQPRNGKAAPKSKLGKPGRGRSRKDSNRPEDWDGDFEDNPSLHALYNRMAEETGG